MMFETSKSSSYKGLTIKHRSQLKTAAIRKLMMCTVLYFISKQYTCTLSTHLLDEFFGFQDIENLYNIHLDIIAYPFLIIYHSQNSPFKFNSYLDSSIYRILQQNKHSIELWVLKFLFFHLKIKTKAGIKFHVVQELRLVQSKCVHIPSLC